MTEKTHTVYFIGGPEDQAKRVYPGEKPLSDWLATAEMIASAPLPAWQPSHVANLECIRHEYRLIPVPNLTPHSRGRIFTAVHVGRLQ